MATDSGRVPDGTGLSSTTEPAGSLGPSGFDPSRVQTLTLDDLAKALIADLAKFDAEIICEACGAPLFDGDDYVSDPDGVSGCWAAMTDLPSKQGRPCYAYRVGKASASDSEVAPPFTRENNTLKYKMGLKLAPPSDSDGSPKGGDGEAGSVEDDSAGPKGIAP